MLFGCFSPEKGLGIRDQCDLDLSNPMMGKSDTAVLAYSLIIQIIGFDLKGSNYALADLFKRQYTGDDKGRFAHEIVGSIIQAWKEDSNDDQIPFSPYTKAMWFSITCCVFFNDKPIDGLWGFLKHFIRIIPFVNDGSKSAKGMLTEDMNNEKIRNRIL